MLERGAGRQTDGHPSRLLPVDEIWAVEPDRDIGSRGYLLEETVQVPADAGQRLPERGDVHRDGDPRIPSTPSDGANRLDTPADEGGKVAKVRCRSERCETESKRFSKAERELTHVERKGSKVGASWERLRQATQRGAAGVVPLAAAALRLAGRSEAGGRVLRHLPGHDLVEDLGVHQSPVGLPKLEHDHADSWL